MVSSVNELQFRYSHWAHIIAQVMCSQAGRFQIPG